MSITVPAILKYLSSNDNIHGNMDEEMRPSSRAKKRRLDHLTWEEKVQRKKLKNRVAAQTSRDRKKAKMEEMEHALQELFYKNEELMKECKELRNMNKKLNEENLALRNTPVSCKCSQNRTVECGVQKGSAEGSRHIFSSGFEDTNNNSTLEDCIGLPSLPDLLNELDRDVDIDSLEELTQSLLQDIAADLEAAAQKTNREESPVDGADSKQSMVGTSSKELESSGCNSIKVEPGLEQEISPYLLLHHNYSAKEPPPKKIKQHKKLNTKTRPKLIMPKVEPVDSSDVLYGTLDETTNCITIIVDDTSLRLSEAVTEVITTEKSDDCKEVLEIPYKEISEYSPYSSSDCGYESLDSPHGLEEPDEWDKSVSELFPTLI